MTQSWLDLGSLLYTTVKAHPGGVGLFIAQFKALKAPTQRQRDVLPLPLPPLGRFHKYINNMQSTSIAKQHRQQKAKLSRKACSDVWLWLVVFALNYEFYGSLVPDVAAVNSFSSLTAGQVSCIQLLREGIRRICLKPCSDIAVPPLFEILQKGKVDYSGEEVCKALPLVFEEVMPSLPDKDSAGTVSALGIAAPHVASWLLTADEQLLPKEEWPSEIPRARMNCTHDEWLKIAVELWVRRMAEPIELHDIFSVDGVPVLNGVFGVKKKGTPPPGVAQITRLIVNLVPTNSYQRMLETDLSTLSPSTTWSNIAIGEEEVFAVVRR